MELAARLQGEVWLGSSREVLSIDEMSGEESGELGVGESRCG